MAAMATPQRSSVLKGGPSTPLTRSILSPLSASNSPSFARPDDECIIFSFTSRYLQAGFSGEALPRCTIPFSPELAKRNGDFSQYIGNKPSSKERIRKWNEWELWTNDLRGFDLDLLDQKLIRTIGITFEKYLLAPPTKRTVLVLPSQLSHPLLESLMRVFFGTYLTPSIGLLSAPVLSTVAAGVRNALVVDIGWEETVVTAIYELREVRIARTIRSGRRVAWAFQQELEKLEGDAEFVETEALRFDELEELIARLAVCPSKEDTAQSEVITTPRREIPGSTAAIVAEVFFPPLSRTDFDDHEMPPVSVAYNVLQQMSIDARAACLPRIIITGDSADIPGVKSRFLQELDSVIDSQGWDPISGSAADKLRERKSTNSTAGSPIAPHTEAPDPLLRSSFPKQPAASPKPRLLNSLGPWSGASLLSDARVRTAVEIDRERFMSGGLSAIMLPEGPTQTVTMASGKRMSLAPGAKGVVMPGSSGLGSWA